MTDMTAADNLSGGKGSKPVIVLSGVNVREVGSLSIYRDALDSLQGDYGERYEIVALVKSRELFDTPGVRYLEYPRIMRSWLARVRFEYWQAKKLSRELKPYLWLSMHDMTPAVEAESQMVYCQNASPFYRVSLREFLLDRRFGMFSFFYRYLYCINLHKNRYVIVQQDWMRHEFERMYGVRNVIVAHPKVQGMAIPQAGASMEGKRAFRFFYPMFPRTYKNPELLLRAARILEARGFHDFEIWLTFDAKVNRYARQVVKEFGEVRSVRWLGQVSRERVQELYGECDCLLFPSRLETWGLPLSEFRPFGKPMLVADLPYAHETCAGYDLVRFIDPFDAEALADLMSRAARHEPIFRAAPEVVVAQPFARDWVELWRMVLGE